LSPAIFWDRRGARRHLNTVEGAISVEHESQVYPNRVPQDVAACELPATLHAGPVLCASLARNLALPDPPAVVVRIPVDHAKAVAVQPAAGVVIRHVGQGRSLGVAEPRMCLCLEVGLHNELKEVTRGHGAEQHEDTDYEPSSAVSGRHGRVRSAFMP